MKNQFIKDLTDGNSINDYFAVKSRTAPSPYKNKSGLWFSLTVSDKTGDIPVKFWGGATEQTVKDLYASFDLNDVVQIKGLVQHDSYANALTISINEDTGELKKIDTFDIKDFLPTTDKDIPTMISQLKEIIESIQDTDIKQLLKSFFDVPEFMKKYSETPAAKSNHHNYVGGLLEHVLGLIKISGTLTSVYPELNSELMIAGCILHDIGKIEEYETKTAITFTTEGSLLGHITIGSKMVEEKINSISNFSEITRKKIIHMILSHHGTKEFGSPVLPQFPEAIALHKIDDCDAKVKFSLQLKQMHNSDDELVWTKMGYMYLK